MVGPRHTFEDLAIGSNVAFARWDLAHLNLFEPADGSIITDPNTGHDFATGLSSYIRVIHDAGKAKPHRFLKPGDEFKLTFDLGDDWVHRCVVAETKVDPKEVFGGFPRDVVPIWGWGQIPDQYVRRTMGDDGQTVIPPEPKLRHPMTIGG